MEELNDDDDDCKSDHTKKKNDDQLLDQTTEWEDDKDDNEGPVCSRGRPNVPHGSSSWQNGIEIDEDSDDRDSDNHKNHDDRLDHANDDSDVSWESHTHHRRRRRHRDHSDEFPYRSWDTDEDDNDYNDELDHDDDDENDWPLLPHTHTRRHPGPTSRGGGGHRRHRSRGGRSWVGENAGSLFHDKGEIPPPPHHRRRRRHGRRLRPWNNVATLPWLERRVQALVEYDSWIHPADLYAPDDSSVGTIIPPNKDDLSDHTATKPRSSLHALIQDCCNLHTIQGMHWAHDILDRLCLEKRAVVLGETSSGSTTSTPLGVSKDTRFVIPLVFWHTVLQGWIQFMQRPPDEETTGNSGRTELHTPPAPPLWMIHAQIHATFQRAVAEAEWDLQHAQQNEGAVAAPSSNDDKHKHSNVAPSTVFPYTSPRVSSRPTVDFCNTYLYAQRQVAAATAGGSSDSCLFDTSWLDRRTSSTPRFPVTSLNPVQVAQTTLNLMTQWNQPPPQLSKRQGRQKRRKKAPETKTSNNKKTTTGSYGWSTKPTTKSYMLVMQTMAHASHSGSTPRRQVTQNTTATTTGTTLGTQALELLDKIQTTFVQERLVYEQKFQKPYFCTATRWHHDSKNNQQHHTNKHRLVEPDPYFYTTCFQILAQEMAAQQRIRKATAKDGTGPSSETPSSTNDTEMSNNLRSTVSLDVVLRHFDQAMRDGRVDGPMVVALLQIIREFIDQEPNHKVRRQWANLAQSIVFQIVGHDPLVRNNDHNDGGIGNQDALGSRRLGSGFPKTDVTKVYNALLNVWAISHYREAATQCQDLLNWMITQGLANPTSFQTVARSWLRHDRVPTSRHRRHDHNSIRDSNATDTQQQTLATLQQQKIGHMESSVDGDGAILLEKDMAMDKTYTHAILALAESEAPDRLETALYLVREWMTAQEKLDSKGKLHGISPGILSAVLKVVSRIPSSYSNPTETPEATHMNQYGHGRDRISSSTKTDLLFGDQPGRTIDGPETNGDTRPFLSSTGDPFEVALNIWYLVTVTDGRENGRTGGQRSHSPRDTCWKKCHPDHHFYAAFLACLTSHCHVHSIEYAQLLQQVWAQACESGQVSRLVWSRVWDMVHSANQERKGSHQLVLRPELPVSTRDVTRLPRLWWKSVPPEWQ